MIALREAKVEARKIYEKMCLTRTYPKLNSREINQTILDIYKVHSKLKMIKRTLEFNGLKIEFKNGIDDFEILNRPTI